MKNLCLVQENLPALIDFIKNFFYYKRTPIEGLIKKKSFSRHKTDEQPLLLHRSFDGIEEPSGLEVDVLESPDASHGHSCPARCQWNLAVAAGEASEDPSGF